MQRALCAIDGPPGTGPAIEEEPVLSTHLKGSNVARFVVAALAVIVASLPLTASAEYSLPQITDTYAVTGSVYTNDPGLATMVPEGFAVDVEGNVWTVENDWTGLDYAPARLVQYSPEGVVLNVYSDGLGLRYPLDVKLSPNGLLYIADAGLNLSVTGDEAWDSREGDGRIIIVNPSTGAKVGQYPVDNQPGPTNLSQVTESMDRFKCPIDIAFTSDGTYVVTDYAYNRVVKFNQADVPVMAIGSITPGTGDTDFDHPAGSFLTTAGAVWVADSYNSRVKHFSVEGTQASLVASYSADFTGSTDSLYNPRDVHIDSFGVVYVLDWNTEDRFVRFTQDAEWLGAFSTTAPGFVFSSPMKILVDQDGTVLTTNYLDHDGMYLFDGAVRKFGLNAGEPDITPPTTVSDWVANWESGWAIPPISLHLSATDASTTVSGTYYSLDGSPPSESYVDSITVEGEGERILKYFSVDRIGNIEDVVQESIFLDGTPPETFASVETTYYGFASISLIATDTLSGVAVTESLLDGVFQTDTTRVTYVQGTHYLSYHSRDRAGNVEQAHEVSFVVAPYDEDPPQTTWDQRRDDWFTEDTLVSFTATDTVSGVEATYYKLGESDWATYTAPVLFTDEGIHTLQFYSVDPLGHKEATQTATLKLDKTKPQTTANVPVGAIGTGTVTLEAFDGGSGLQRTEWRFDYQPSFTEGTVIDLPTWGNYTIFYRSTDVAGNSEGVHTLYVSIERPDEEPPTTDSNIPESGWVQGLPLRELVLTASDYVGGSGVSETVLSVDGGPWIPYVPGTHQFAEGQYEISFYSIDHQENQETTQTRTLRVDSTPPTSWTDAVEFYAGPATINLFAQDNLSSALPRYRLDNGSVITGVQINLTDYRTYVLEYWAVDGAGHEEIPHHTMTIAVSPPDLTPPVTTITAPTGWQKGFATFSLAASDASSAVQSTHFSLNGAWPQTYFGSHSVTSEGTTTIDYWSIDSYNNREATKTAAVYVDASPPITTSDAVFTYTDVAPITLTPTDAYSGVANTYYKVNGGAYTTYTAPFSVQWSRWRRYHTIEWYSVDSVGNIEAKQSYTFEIKLNPLPYHSSDSRIVYRGPWATDYSGDVQSVDATSSFAFLSFQGTQLELSARKGPGMGIVRASLLDTDVPPALVDLYSNNERDGTYNPPAWTTGILDYGDYTVKLEWTGDKNPLSDGTKVNIDEVRIEGALTEVADTAPPITVHTAPTGWVRGPVIVSLASTDATTGVKGVYATSNGTTPTVATPYAGAYTVTAQGITTIRYYADDNRGNVESLKSCEVKIDDVAPVTSIPPARSYTTTATFALLPTDAHSGVAASRWRVDGGSWTTGTAVSIPGTSLGDHVLEWYSIDNVGNTETTQSAVIAILNRYEQTEPAMLYRGSWATNTTGSHSAGSWRTASTTGAWAYVPFNGTRIDVIGAKGPNYGQARVSIDGGSPVVLDYYAATLAQNQRLHSFTGLSAGAHVLSIEWLSSRNASSTGNIIGLDAVDIVGTLASDSTPPTTTDNVIGGWHNAGQLVSLVATDNTFVTSTRYRVNGSALTTYTVPFTVSGEGENVVEYFSTDLAGNVETTKPVSVFVDTTAPALTDDVPAQWVQGPVDVTLGATDAGSDVMAIMYSLDGSAASTYSAAVRVSKQGTTELSYYALDNVGNVSDVATVAVKVDNVAPVTSDDAPEGWVGGSVSVELTAHDVHSGAAEIVYSVDGSPEQTYTAPVEVTAEGTTTIEYYAVDAAGNIETAQEAIVLLDSTPPSSTDDAPTSWVASDTTVNVVSTDTLSGVERIEYSLDGSPVATTAGPIAILGGGVHTLQYRAIDVVGNIESTRTATVRIDATAPVTTSNALITTYSSTATVSLTATDTQSGVALTKWRLNGSTWTTGTVLTVPGSMLGTHTIEWFSTDAVGNVESIKLATVRMGTRFEQETMTSYTGTWSQNSDGGASGGSYRFSSVTSSTLDVSFWGTSIDLVAIKGGSYGIAKVTLDGVSHDVDLYNNGLKYRQVAWSSGTLTEGRHTLRVEVSGTK
ncbi:MAG: NHL repeat-containing protein, partial [Coriobacteriia bacterium]|nr:NHL repeat-containing protein [Coriobacteriia bacterium]